MNLSWIKKVYLYLVSLISLVILVIAGIMLINIGIKTWVFPKADELTYQNVYCPQEVKNPDGTVVAQSPECSDPNYAKNMSNAQKQSDAAQAMSMILIATPVFLYHWRLARKEV